MPIVIEPMRKTTLREFMDLWRLTLVLREDTPGEWNGYILDPMGVEYALDDEWGIYSSDSAEEVAGAVCELITDADELELGEATINCSNVSVEVGQDDLSS